MTSEAPLREFLGAIRRVTRQVALYPQGHPMTDDALAAAAETADMLAGASGGEAVVALTGDSFYLDRVLHAHTSLEYNALLRELNARDIISLSLRKPVSPGDVFDLATFVAGLGDDLPADGTIRLNETSAHLRQEAGSRFASLRRSYAGSLESVREATQSLAAEGAFELNSVATAVESLLDSSLEQSGAALLLATVTSHDEYTFFHSVNACLYSLALGRAAGVSRDSLIAMGVGAILHDIGKVAISPRVLNYPGRLEPDEWREVTIHPQEGALAILAASGPGAGVSATIALEHHLSFAGEGGYPSWSGRKKPHVLSRIVTVVDTYDAVTTRRAYRRAESPARALRIISDGAGTRYDPDVVRLFTALVGIYPPGSVLRLRDDRHVLVTHSDPDDPGRPRGSLIVDRTGAVIDDPEPVQFDPSDVVALVPADALGISPAAYLERLAPEQLLA